MRRALARALASDVGLKAVSLLLAAGLFAWVRGEQETEVRALLRLEYDLPPGVALVDRPPGEARVRIAGSRLRLGRFEAADVPPVHIAVARARDGKVRLSPELFDLPKGLRVTYISPAVLSVATEPLLERRVPVRARVPAGGARAQVTPPSVVVSGPRSLVQALDEIDTRELDGKTGSVRVRLDAPRGVKLRPSRVDVRIAADGARP